MMKLAPPLPCTLSQEKGEYVLYIYVVYSHGNVVMKA
jgi:hypothetical protein